MIKLTNRALALFFSVCKFVVRGDDGRHPIVVGVESAHGNGGDRVTALRNQGGFGFSGSLIGQIGLRMGLVNRLGHLYPDGVIRVDFGDPITRGFGQINVLLAEGVESPGSVAVVIGNQVAQFT